MAADLGTPGYGIGLNDTWYRQTASHATVLLDGHSQPLASGRLGPFRERGDVTIAEGTVSWDEGTSANVQLRRVLLSRKDYFVDLFEVDAAAEHQIDWLYQHRGDLIESPAGTEVSAGLAGDCGYAHVTNVSQVQDPSATRLRWQKAGARLRSLPAPGKR